MKINRHEFERPEKLTGGFADRKCRVCGLEDRNPVHKEAAP